MRRIELWGHEVGYLERPGSGPAVVLVHGLGGTHDAWTRLVDHLPTDFHVLAPDLPGHGTSQAGHGDHSVGAAASAIRDLMVAVGLRSATLIGHSLGGGVGMQFAYQFPDRTERLGLIGSAGLGAEVAAGLRIVSTVPGSSAALWAASRAPRRVQETLLRPATWWAASRAETTAITDDLRRLRDSGHRRTFLQTARSVIDHRGQRVDAVSRLPAFADLPMLMVWGGRDPVIPPAQQQTAARAAQLPPALAVELRTAGHYPHRTHPAEVAELVTRLVRTTRPYRHDDATWRAALTGDRREADAAPPAPQAPRTLSASPARRPDQISTSNHRSRTRS